jgi:diguanylate cyclase (GGDEF)-like protein
MRLLTPSLVLLFGTLFSLIAAATVSGPSTAFETPLDVTLLDAPLNADAVTSGANDADFRPLKGAHPGAEYWLRIPPAVITDDATVRALVLQVTRGIELRVYDVQDGVAQILPRATALSGFLAVREDIYVPPPQSQRALYAHVAAHGAEERFVGAAATGLDAKLGQAAQRTRMIALCFGALCAVSISGFLIWFVLKDAIFILYGFLFSLQAIYIAYLSGQGFDWPVLSAGASLGSFAWNVPVGLSGAVASLFTREIADLKRSSPRIYRSFGWIAVAFVVVTAANAFKFAGIGSLVNALGNFMFVGAALFTVVVCFMAWRRGNRAAGWFLISWGMLEGVAIAAALRFLFTSKLDSDDLYFYDMPLSMVAASLLVALGVADRLRAQRAALSDAERRAQTDPLTGVLNRRSLVERLDGICLRAQARGLPVSLLFIDLDHFKQINDTYGHQAGDACLRAIIEPIQTELRQSDFVGRYGGEEFVVILTSADAAAAAPIAQRIVDRVAGVRVEGFGKPIAVTCSIGVAASDTLGVWGEQLMARADAAVYVAKHSGRNCFHMARPLAVLG